MLCVCVCVCVCVRGGGGVAVWRIEISIQFIWIICATLLKYIPEMFLNRSNWIQFFFRYKSTHLYSCCWKLGLRTEEVHCSGWFLEVICFLVLMLATRMSFYSIMWLYQAWNGKNKNIAVIYSPQPYDSFAKWTYPKLKSVFLDIFSSQIKCSSDDAGLVKWWINNVWCYWCIWQLMVVLLKKMIEDSLKILFYVFHRLNAALERHECE